MLNDRGCDPLARENTPGYYRSMNKAILALVLWSLATASIAQDKPSDICRMKRLVGESCAPPNPPAETPK